MKSYLSNILPRIQQFSKKLDNTSLFVDIPWIFIDEEGNKLTYIFRRNNELLISKAGEVTSGKWEYLPFADSLLIDIEGQKRLYKHGFLDEGLMIMRKDETDNLFITINSKKIPDLDVESYVGYLESKTAFSSFNNQNQITEKKPSRRTESSEVKIPVREARLVNGIVIYFEGLPGEKVVNLNSYQPKKVFFKETGKSLENGKYDLDNGDKISVFKGECTYYESKSDVQFKLMVVVVIIIIIFVLLISSFS